MNALPARAKKSRSCYGGTGKIKPWRCTERSKPWCPLCGDCMCGGREKPTEKCPLHAPSSLHGQREELVT